MVDAQEIIISSTLEQKGTIEHKGKRRLKIFGVTSMSSSPVCAVARF